MRRISPNYSRLSHADGLARPVLSMVHARPEHVEQGLAQMHSRVSAAANGRRSTASAAANSTEHIVFLICSARRPRWTADKEEVDNGHRRMDRSA